MKMLRTLFALFALACTIPTVAQTTTQTTVTITVPKAIVWVAPDGTGVAPYLGGGTSYFFDANGFIWRLFDVAGTAPYAAPYNHGDGAGAWWYETTTCTGPAYLVSDVWVNAKEAVEIVEATGVVYAARTLAATSVATTLRAKLLGGVCTAVTLVVPGTFVAYSTTNVVLLTPPTLPGGPYHMEYR